MKNKFDETGIDSGEVQSMARDRKDASSTDSHPGQQPLPSVGWADPEASRVLILELMGMVNTRKEYKMLQRDLAEVDELLRSRSLKGGAAETVLE